MTEKAPLLQAIVESVRDKDVAIFLGAGPDPDGLASQAVMGEICELAGARSVRGFYRGSFNRPQNRTMHQELSLTPVEESKFDPTEFEIIISVDGPSGTCPALPHFIIDHHSQSEPALIGSDVRLIGSTSAIMWEYAMAYNINFTTERGTILATALALGVITDTKNGSIDNASDLDFETLAFCLKHKDNNLYKKIVNYPKPAYYHDLYVQGWKNRIIEGAVLVSGVGNLPAGRSGVISDLAEKYAETEGISTAVVFAMVDGNIDISVRSTNSALNVDDFVKKAFGGGGGKRGAGRCLLNIPLFQNTPDELQNKLFRSLSEIIVHKALQNANDGMRENKSKPENVG